jgi:hypothetical protein
VPFGSSTPLVESGPLVEAAGAPCCWPVMLTFPDDEIATL